MDDSDLLRCLLHVVGRIGIPEKTTREIIGSGKNRVKAFNLCDGTMTLEDIRRKTKIDSGNFSRAAASWVENGIAFWVGERNTARLLHIYPIPVKERKPTTK